MLFNDPMLYGATLPYDIPIQSHYYPQFATPWQSTPWQSSQWQPSQWQSSQWQPSQWQSIPWQDVNKYVPQDFSYLPYQRYQSWQQFPQSWQQFPVMQQPTFLPWMQRPFAFSQPFNFSQPYNHLNMPFCNWQRPFIY